MNPLLPKPKVDVHQAFMETRIRPVIKPLMVDLLRDQPPNVLRYIAEWCRAKEVESSEPRETGGLHRRPSEALSDEEDALLEQRRQATRKKLAVSAESSHPPTELLDWSPPQVPKSSAETAQILEILKLNFIFSELDDKETLAVAGAMEIRKARAKETVIEQGDDGDELFLVCSGSLRCQKTLENQSAPAFPKQLGRGDIFGELALLYNAPRAATVVAETDCLLFSLDRETFNRIVRGAAARRREAYQRLLSKVEILTDLRESEREKLCDCLRTETYRQGELVVRQGDAGRHLYFVMEGTAEAIQREGGSEKIVFEFAENDYFGELALINNAPRQASVRVTSERLVAAALDAESFKRLLGPIEGILARNAAKYAKYINN